MIRIDLNVAVALYLGFSIVVMFMWIFFEWKKRAITRLKTNNTLWECPTCFYTYIDSCSENISKCPKCKTLHKKE